MLAWIFPVFLVCWLATILLDRRVRRRATHLPSPAREQLTAILGESWTPAKLRKAILRRELRAVPDGEFLRAGTLYRASIILYVIAGFIMVVVIVLGLLAR